MKKITAVLIFFGFVFSVTTGFAKTNNHKHKTTHGKKSKKESVEHKSAQPCGHNEDGTISMDSGCKIPVEENSSSE